MPSLAGVECIVIPSVRGVQMNTLVMNVARSSCQTRFICPKAKALTNPRTWPQLLTVAVKAGQQKNSQEKK